MRYSYLSIVACLLLLSSCAVHDAPSAVVEESTTSCPTTGRSKKGGLPREELQELNKLKNRREVPGGDHINRDVTMLSLYDATDNKNAFSEQDGVTIVGYLADAREEEGESCNCYSEADADHDIHVFLSPTDNIQDRKKRDCIVVELTPYSKQLLPEWTAHFIKQNKGHKVRVTGWLMHDNEHIGQSWASHPRSERLHRRNVWEIHPITNIELLD
jgi:hypothetical protein